MAGFLQSTFGFLCCTQPKAVMLVNELTNPMNTSLDKNRVAQLVSLVNSQPKENGKHVAKALVSKLDDWSPLTQLLALMLLETLMKECTITFFDILAARSVPQLLSTLAIRFGTNEDVQAKAEELLQEFAMTVLLDDTVNAGLSTPLGAAFGDFGSSGSLKDGKRRSGSGARKVGERNRAPSASFSSAVGRKRFPAKAWGREAVVQG